jgi:hypothetical protein
MMCLYDSPHLQEVFILEEKPNKHILENTMVYVPISEAELNDNEWSGNYSS